MSKILLGFWGDLRGRTGSAWKAASCGNCPPGPPLAWPLTTRRLCGNLWQLSDRDGKGQRTWADIFQSSAWMILTDLSFHSLFWDVDGCLGVRLQAPACLSFFPNDVPVEQRNTMAQFEAKRGVVAHHFKLIIRVIVLVKDTWDVNGAAESFFCLFNYVSVTGFIFHKPFTL